MASCESLLSKLSLVSTKEAESGSSSPLVKLVVIHEDIFRDALAPFLWIPDALALAESLDGVGSGAKDKVLLLPWACHQCPLNEKQVLICREEGFCPRGPSHCSRNPHHFLCRWCTHNRKKYSLYGETAASDARCYTCQAKACECRPLSKCLMCDVKFCHNCKSGAKEKETIMSWDLDEDVVAPAFCFNCETYTYLCSKCVTYCKDCGGPACSKCEEEECEAGEDCLFAGTCRTCTYSETIYCSFCNKEYHVECFEQQGGSRCNHCQDYLCCNYCREYDCCSQSEEEIEVSGASAGGV